jgi:hypothetical protein
MLKIGLIKNHSSYRHFKPLKKPGASPELTFRLEYRKFFIIKFLKTLKLNCYKQNETKRENI